MDKDATFFLMLTAMAFTAIIGVLTNSLSVILLFGFEVVLVMIGLCIKGK